MPFQYHHLSIPDAVLIEAKIIKDDRGFFQEIFKASDFEAHGFHACFVQDNHSRSQ
jgi:dTDP-4-dehydrorhamnose 3,5-epimerase